MTTQLVPTLTNMVTSVRNIMDGYRMGPMRALAQEPVQNSKDAAINGRPARVEYRLHRRQQSGAGGVYMLTITDSNTSGLQGPIPPRSDTVKGDYLAEGENWAAFEGMGYTKKSSEESLGSRGQGKAAYLYHSILPQVSASSGQERMIMLYDTLLANNEYRLGMRYAKPSDVVQNPPLSGDEARRVVRESYTEHGLEINLMLEPLTQVGTRVIMPFLSTTAVEAFRSGELLKWLQRCWWRAVQTGLTIDLVDENGARDTVTVPSWWQDEPWKMSTPGLRAEENIKVLGALKIKRIVLFYDESLSETDIDGSDPQFWGVQLLRGQQWIETLGSNTLGDYIPRDKRPGFRGFVEFDKRTERVLRSAEGTQHEHFDLRVTGVKALVNAIEEKVRKFAEEQNWANLASVRPAPGSEVDAAMDFLRFMNPKARRDSGNGRGSSEASKPMMDLPRADRWECDLSLDFPVADSARVDWGQYLRNVEARVRLDPPRDLAPSSVSLELEYADGRAAVVPIGNRELQLWNGEAIVRFGDFQVITGRSAHGKLQCAQRGKYQLTARVETNGTQVVKTTRTFYVGEEPPAYDSNPYTISISLENHTTRQERRRINNGDTIGVQISIKNHTPEPQTLILDASLGASTLVKEEQVQADGTAPGATPVPVAGFQQQIVVNPTTQDERQSVTLEEGIHTLNADLLLNGEVVAHAGRRVHVEVDPSREQGWPPFAIEQIDGGQHPRWQFNKDKQDDWRLQYPPSYPLHRALAANPSRNGSQFSGVSAFVIDVCAEGIIEWVMEPLDAGDSSRLDELLDGRREPADAALWDIYCEKMRELGRLRRSQEQVGKYGQLVRECAALSLSLFEGRM